MTDEWDHDHDGETYAFGECITCARRTEEELAEPVAAAVDEEWAAKARQVVGDLAATGADFCSDDVWERLPTTSEPRALGAVMRWASESGLIERTTEFRRSTRPENHHRPIALWRGTAPAATSSVAS